jgi:hypothetical protein
MLLNRWNMDKAGKGQQKNGRAITIPARDPFKKDLFPEIMRKFSGFNLNSFKNLSL